MKNRTKYIIKRNEYDLMMAIAKNTNCCPIVAITGQYPDNGYGCKHDDSKCLKCVQEWLNKED